MYYLPKNSRFGKLTIISEYLRYDIPRAFLAANKQKEKFFAYWTNEYDDADGWYYIKINDDEHRKLESGLIQVRDLYAHKNIVWIKTPYDISLPTEEKTLSIEDVDFDALPPENFAIEKINGEFDLVEKSPEYFKVDTSFHEVRIYKPRSSKSISWDIVKSISNAWADFCEAVLKLADPDNYSFIPAGAETGSYRMHFQTSDNDQLVNKFNDVLSALGSDDSAFKITELGIDPVLVENLMSALQTNEVMLDLRTNTSGLINTLNYKELDDASKELSEYSQTHIPSEHIPQADDILRVIKYVKSKANNEPFNCETEGIVPRQILYYASAAKILGFVNSFDVLTPIGHRLSEQELIQDQFKILIERFETSPCGWAWMKYCNVKTVCDIDENTAKNFLLECSLGLSEATAIRRSQTLKGWILKFKEFC